MSIGSSKKKFDYMQCWRMCWETRTLKYNGQEGNLTIRIKIITVYPLTQKFHF